MKEFIAPSLEPIEDMSFEPIYAASGGGGGHDKDPRVDVDYTSHNSGSHSVAHIQVNNPGKCGEQLVMTFVTDFKIGPVYNTSGTIFGKISDNSFSITRNNHYNATDSIGFNIEIEKASGGAVGVTGQVCHKAIICTGLMAN